MGAADLLRDLAGKTAHAPEPPGTGRYDYVRTSGSYLRVSHFLSRTGGSTITAVIEPFERRQWVAADGSGRLLVTQGEVEVVPPSGDYAPGQLSALFITATDEDSLSAELGRLSSKTTTSDVMKTFQQVWNLQVVTPALQRLLLLNLAKCANLTVEETPQEFADRSGVAVAHLDNVRHRRSVLVFSPESGELIGAEETALEGAEVPIAVPAVISRTEWLFTGYCETTAEAPRRR